MHIIGFLIFGLIVGLLARAIYPGRQNMGWLSTAILGVTSHLARALVLERGDEADQVADAAVAFCRQGFLATADPALARGRSA